MAAEVVVMMNEGAACARLDRPARRGAPPNRVIVADDDDATREAVVSALVDDGHDVIGLTDGTQVIECLEIFSRDGLRPPDLIALDVRMLGSSGIDFLEDIRRAGWAIPVVLMTVHDASELRSRVEGTGLATIIEKPFATQELCDLARRIRHGQSGAR